MIELSFTWPTKL
uniref:Uncharacterized protein n=1 Tax=Arundo donax TaxID=35708 RepID=A0A0A9FHI7_ARUDO